MERSRFPAARRFITAGARVGRRMSPMHGLIEVDVTKAVQMLADQGLSFTAFVVASVGRAAARHPQVHAYRDWLGRVVVHNHVDATVLIEVKTKSGPFPLAHLVRDADVREVRDIGDEIRGVRQNPTAATEGRWLDRFAPLGGKVPGLPWVLYQIMARSTKMRAVSGTVAISSLSMFGSGSGHGIGIPMVLSLTVIVGGRERRPIADGDGVGIAEVLDLTVTFDHNTVDGAPAARFVAELRDLLTSAEVLS